MSPLALRTTLPILAMGIAAVSAGCGSDSVGYIVYPLDDYPGGSLDGGSTGGDDASSSGGTSSGGSGSGSSGSGSGASGSGGGSSSSGGPSTSSGGGDAGPCDMTGYWFAAQHSVANALSFKEIAVVYYYFDLTQTGTTVKVNHGLHCGLSVLKSPNNLAGGGDTVSLDAAALLSRQDEGQTYGSQAGRTGTMTKTSSGCQFHLNKYYTVRGATVGYFDDPSKMMSASMPVASGCGANFANCTTPGSEDWDNDGNPGITLSVAWTANGNIYAAQRDFSEFYGTVALGASKFEVGLVDPSGQVAVGPEQYALGYGGGCTNICSTTSANDACPSSGCASEYFVDFVRLDSPPGSSNTDICAYVFKNAPTLAPRALDANDVPTEPKYQ